jgi:Helix-turn-helix domain
VPDSAYVALIGHETKYSLGVQLRYSYRPYPAPGQQQALAGALGCARVVLNDGLRARRNLHPSGVERMSMPAGSPPAAARHREIS